MTPSVCVLRRRTWSQAKFHGWHAMANSRRKHKHMWAHAVAAPVPQAVPTAEHDGLQQGAAAGSGAAARGKPEAAHRRRGSEHRRHRAERGAGLYSCAGLGGNSNHVCVRRPSNSPTKWIGGEAARLCCSSVCTLVYLGVDHVPRRHREWVDDQPVTKLTQSCLILLVAIQLHIPTHPAARTTWLHLHEFTVLVGEVKLCGRDTEQHNRWPVGGGRYVVPIKLHGHIHDLLWWLLPGPTAFPLCHTVG